MRNPHRFLRFSALLFFCFLTYTAFGQDTLLGVVEYLDDPLEAQITLPDGSEAEAYIGLELIGGTIIQTFFTTVEIRLTAGGSLLRLSENTLFRIEPQRIAGDKKVNAFTMAAGTVRCVAARASDQGYAVHTPTAAMGVRGTDFIVEVFEGGETLSVLDGVVEALHKATGRSNLVQAGFFQNLVDENALPQVLTDALRDQLLEKNTFQALDPAEVVHQASEAGAVDLAQETREREPAGEEGKNLWDMVFTPRTGSSSDASGDTKADKAPRKEKKTEEGDVSFVLSAGLHPELVQIAQSTWTQLMGMGVGGSVSLTAGFAKTPGFFAGLTGGFAYLSGKSAGSLDNSFWVPLGFLAGIRTSLSGPLSFYGAGEGGMQYTRMIYSIEGLPNIDGWGPYIAGRLGLRYDLSPLVLEAGAAFGAVLDAGPIPFLRATLGVVYEVRL